MKPSEYNFAVLRGGAWFDVAGVCRSAFRHDWHPGYRYSYLGFRLARTCPRPLDDLTAIAKSEDSQ
jgi:formylglycine-generating enzyme required for sulfatase activity